MDICEVCGEEVRGGFEVYERPEKNLIVVDSTPDRNFNICDLCNKCVCFRCSKNPDSGYCNECLARLSTAGNARDYGKGQNKNY
jgi:hypothetical protein